MATVAATNIPHRAYPFRMVTQPDGSLAADVNEQDSLDDILDCAQAIVACPAGAWIDNLGFGVPSLAFSQTPLDADGVGRAVSRWEPRAMSAAREYPDKFDQTLRHVQVDVTTQQSDQ